MEDIKEIPEYLLEDLLKWAKSRTKDLIDLGFDGTLGIKGIDRTSEKYVKLYKIFLKDVRSFDDEG